MFNITDTMFKYASAGLLVVSIGLGVVIAFQRADIAIKSAEIRALEAEKRELTVKLETTISININLNTLIDKQNESIRVMAENKKELDDRLKKADTDAKKIRSSYEKRIADLMNAPIGNDCESSLNWLRIKAPELSTDTKE